MQPNPYQSHINKIFFGSVVWGIFYLHLFYDATRFQASYVGSVLGVPYSYELIYSIQIVFFSLLIYNLIQFTIGKKYSPFDVSRFFKVFIFASLIVSIIQGVLIHFNLSFHFGLIGYFVGRGSFLNETVEQGLFLYILYSTGLILMMIYLSLVLVYIYQLYKSNISFPFSMLLKIGMTLFIYGYSLGFSFSGFSFLTLAWMVLYLLFGFIVYLKTKYSLKALIVSIILLFIL